MKHVVQALVLLTIVAMPAHAGVSMTLAPEPATLGLVATGIAVVGGVAWLRRRRR
ncbi:MAG TPA: PEP-CTERM sorting domain-containing protein [Gemmatimonadaceae bacterium]|nr:PEP-CTERM sorting domain-containing protein [Gemmatimonadaceae bacterium]